MELMYLAGCQVYQLTVNRAAGRVFTSPGISFFLRNLHWCLQRSRFFLVKVKYVHFIKLAIAKSKLDIRRGLTIRGERF